MSIIENIPHHCNFMVYWFDIKPGVHDRSCAPDKTYNAYNTIGQVLIVRF